MKKFNLTAVALLLASSMMYTSCVGSYALFNKYANWQTHMTSNKYVNGIVGILIGWLVGGVALFVDELVLNTIEFWSGSNPVANNTTVIKGKDGQNYLVKVSRKGYEIKAPNGQITMLVHDEATDSWSMSQNGVVKEIFRYNPDGTIQANLKDGKTITVSQDEAGLNQVRQAVLGDEQYFALY